MACTGIRVFRFRMFPSVFFRSEPKHSHFCLPWANLEKVLLPLRVNVFSFTLTKSGKSAQGKGILPIRTDAPTRKRYFYPTWKTLTVLQNHYFRRETRRKVAINTKKIRLRRANVLIIYILHIISSVVIVYEITRDKFAFWGKWGEWGSPEGRHFLGTK